MSRGREQKGAERERTTPIYLACKVGEDVTAEQVKVRVILIVAL